MVVANDNPDIGYTFTGKRMLMLDFGGLPGQLDNTNVYFAALFAVPIAIKYKRLEEQPTIYQDNDWASDPKGRKLLTHVPEKLRPARSVAQNAYLTALWAFANPN